jgi:hypothetical protein
MAWCAPRRAGWNGALDAALAQADAMLGRCTALDHAAARRQPTGCWPGSRSTAATIAPATPPLPPPPLRAPTWPATSLRTLLAEAAIARWAVLRDRNTAVARWGGSLQFRAPSRIPSLATWVNDFLALAASQDSDFGAAAGYYIRCYESALESGQLRAAITAATNIGEDFTMLGDHHSALEWMQCALELARPTGWPRSDRRLPDAGRRHPAPAWPAGRRARHAAGGAGDPQAARNARSYAIALQYLGDLSLDQGDLRRRAGRVYRASKAAPMRSTRPISAALPGAARRTPCRTWAAPREALAWPPKRPPWRADQANAHNQIAALRVMAMIHAQPPPAAAARHDRTESGAALPAQGALGGLHHRRLHRAGRAVRRHGARIRRRRRLQARLRVALRPRSAREKTHSQEATNHAIAMQVHHQTEHARSEGYHHRELAESEARRAEVLQRTSATLERLSAIGQEITAHLDAAKPCSARSTATSTAC